eukprot:GHVT01060181.1.p1 GENE.GHVT01060181.1~~GHVT01060181.1.p1  ORF type:complete len:383 (+),score=69.77 GHVT01060181.1:1543-2691(+)
MRAKEGGRRASRQREVEVSKLRQIERLRALGEHVVRAVATIGNFITNIFRLYCWPFSPIKQILCRKTMIRFSHFSRVLVSVVCIGVGCGLLGSECPVLGSPVHALEPIVAPRPNEKGSTEEGGFDLASLMQGINMGEGMPDISSLLSEVQGKGQLPAGMPDIMNNPAAMPVMMEILQEHPDILGAFSSGEGLPGMMAYLMKNPNLINKLTSAFGAAGVADQEDQHEEQEEEEADIPVEELLVQFANEMKYTINMDLFKSRALLLKAFALPLEKAAELTANEAADTAVKAIDKIVSKLPESIQGVAKQTLANLEAPQTSAGPAAIALDSAVAAVRRKYSSTSSGSPSEETAWLVASLKEKFRNFLVSVESTQPIRPYEKHDEL